MLLLPLALFPVPPPLLRRPPPLLLLPVSSSAAAAPPRPLPRPPCPRPRRPPQVAQDPRVGEQESRGDQGGRLEHQEVHPERRHRRRGGAEVLSTDPGFCSIVLSELNSEPPSTVPRKTLTTSKRK